MKNKPANKTVSFPRSRHTGLSKAKHTPGKQRLMLPIPNFSAARLQISSNSSSIGAKHSQKNRLTGKAYG